MVVQVGDSIPSVELHQKTPLEDKVDLSKEITGDAYLVFVPGINSRLSRGNFLHRGLNHC